MSFNNHLAFNISKATPTTSTTNTHTTSTSTSSYPPKLSGCDNSTSVSSRSDPNFPSIQNILSKSTIDTSPKVAAVSTTTSLSGVTPTTVSAADSNEKQDLLDLFGKYDLDHKLESQSGDTEEDVDLIEEKMKQFQVNDTKEVHDDASAHDEAWLIEETTLEKVGESSGKVVEALLTEPMPTESTSELSKKNDSPITQSSSMSIQAYLIPDVKSSEDTVSDPEEINESSIEQANRQEFDAQEGDILNMEATGTAEEFQESAAIGPDSTSTPSPVRPHQHRNNSIVRASEAVNPKERYQQSHKPFDFQVFLNHLKKKSADPIVRYIRSFLVSFSRQANSMTAPQMVMAIRQFKEFINKKFQFYEPFVSMDPVDLENSGEGLEKLIMNRLYVYCFSPEAVKKFGNNACISVFENVKEDEEFLLQVEKFSWILGIHLDVDLDDIAKRKRETSKDSLDYLDFATTQLNKINSYRAPRDKIICILNSCKIIFNLLKVNNQETNADAFIPLLILIIIKAKTPNLISNLHYIEHYRGEEWLNHGETSYYLSSIQGAITFIRNIRKEDLTISDEEYDANMEAWEAELRQRGPPVTRPIPVQGRENLPSEVPRSTMSPSEVIFASAEMFTKSISNFISPSPQERSPIVTAPSSITGETEQQPAVTDEQVDLAFAQLIEIFPTLDKAILRDVIIMNKADVEQSLDVCLSLVNEN